MSTLIFLLALLGSACSQAAVGSPGADGSSAIVGPFLASLLKAVKSADKAAVSALFSDQFLFHGCRGDYNKEKVVGILTSLPAGTKFDISLVSSKFSQQDIEYHVKASGFGPSSVDADFVLRTENGKYVLIGGKIPQCAKSHSAAFASASDESKSAVESFLAVFVAAVKSADTRAIGGYILDDFKFQGCRGEYNKEKIVAHLAHISKDVHFKMTILSAQFVNSNQDIEYSVWASGFGPPQGINAKFILRKKDGKYLLASGSVPECKKSHFSSWPKNPSDYRAFAAASGSDAAVQAFLDVATKAITAHDQEAIARLLSDDFLFKGCKGDYTKDKAVALLVRVPKVDTSIFKGLSSKYTKDQDEITVTSNQVSFVLRKVNGNFVMVSGKVLDCTKPQ